MLLGMTTTDLQKGSCAPVQNNFVYESASHMHGILRQHQLSHLRWVRQKIIGRGLLGDCSGIGRGPLCENVCFAMVFARFAVWGRFG